MGASTKKTMNQEYPRHPFLLPVQEVHRHLGTNKDTGLTKLQAQEALRKYGPNKLKGEGAVQWYTVLVKQVSNAMILVRLWTSYLSIHCDWLPLEILFRALDTDVV